MEICENCYTESEDKMLWELHAIRHKLHRERKNKTIEEINREALKKYSEWQKKGGYEQKIRNKSLQQTDLHPATHRILCTTGTES